MAASKHNFAPSCRRGGSDDEPEEEGSAVQEEDDDFLTPCSASKRPPPRALLLPAPSSSSSSSAGGSRGHLGVLSYMGGKTRAIKFLKQYLPRGLTTICSPFVGGGAFELYCAISEGMRVHAYDADPLLINFWSCLRYHRSRFLRAVSDCYAAMRNMPNYEQQKALYHHWCECLWGRKKRGGSRGGGGSASGGSGGGGDGDSKTRQQSLPCCQTAALYFALNKCSYSGLTGGGFSAPCAQNRFTENALRRLGALPLDNFTFACADFRQSIAAHPDDFLFLDPPYWLEEGKNNLYGHKGELHVDFPHRDLFRILEKRSGGGRGWMLCYNNCEAVRQLYRNYPIIDLDWSYGGKKVPSPCGSGTKEVLILSADYYSHLPTTEQRVSSCRGGQRRCSKT